MPLQTRRLVKTGQFSLNRRTRQRGTLRLACVSSGFGRLAQIQNCQGEKRVALFSANFGVNPPEMAAFVHVLETLPYTVLSQHDRTVDIYEA